MCSRNAVSEFDIRDLFTSVVVVRFFCNSEQRPRVYLDPVSCGTIGVNSNRSMSGSNDLDRLIDVGLATKCYALQCFAKVLAHRHPDSSIPSFFVTIDRRDTVKNGRRNASRLGIWICSSNKSVHTTAIYPSCFVETIFFLEGMEILALASL